jgi:hypothetical protein
MAIFLDDAVPAVLGRNLMRFAPAYTAMQVFQPPTVHDYAAVRTKQVQLDRFKSWGEKGLTKGARRRDKNAIIGTANAEALGKSTKTVAIYEHTGPSDALGNASTLHLTKEDMLYARQMLWQYGIQKFHESVGSANLADDFQRWFDRIHYLEAMATTVKRNPTGKADAATLITDKFTSNDLMAIRYQMAKKNTPRFQDGTYHGAISEEMLFHLMQDDDFKNFARALIQGGQQPVQQAYQHFGPQSLSTAVSGMPTNGMDTPALPPIIYQGFTLFPSNNLPTRTVNSLTAYLGIFTGPGAVGIGSGGRGPVVEVDSQTDFNRHFHFIWSWWGDVVYLLDDDDNSGCTVEARTYAAIS